MNKNRKIFTIISIVILTFSINFFILNIMDNYYSKNINKLYKESIGDIYGNDRKDQGIELQNISAKKNDNLLIFGSSELGSNFGNGYVPNFYKNKRDGFQVNIIGKGYSQSIIHAIDLGSIGEEIKNKKIVIVVSPQWFAPNGIESSEFEMNFSELQFYKMIFDSNTDSSNKKEIAKRVSAILQGTKRFSSAYNFANLYKSDDNISKLVTYISKPFFYMKFKYLSLQAKIQDYKELKKLKLQSNSKRPKQIDWENEFSVANKMGYNQTKSNEFGIEDSYYNEYIKNKLSELKDSSKSFSYSKSLEYEDYNLLLKICKNKNLKVLIVSVPMHGKWYDYCGYNEKTREEYYNNIRKITSQFDNVTLADLSKYEYEDYFLKDTMHLGWKGWLRVDKAIGDFYKQN